MSSKMSSCFQETRLLSRNLKMRLIFAFAVVVLAFPYAMAQEAQGTDEDRMAVPQPVGIDTGSLAFSSETQTNYLSGGITFTSAYDDNILPSTGSSPSDISYSLSPNIAWDITRSRFHSNVHYSPGFTFYQRYSTLNQSDHNLAADLSYRLSPHITMTLRDNFSKLSSVTGFYGADLTGGGSILHAPNMTIAPPVTNYLHNAASGQITYQFSRNAMIGATGNTAELRYLDRDKLTGLFDASARGGSAFYSYRASKKHYLGLTYQFQDILALPNESETQAHSIFGFYTFYVSPRFSVAFFGGPQWSTASGVAVIAGHSWSPAGGVTLEWQGAHTSFSGEYSRRITDSGGLQGATQSSTVSASLRRQLTRFVTMGAGGGYSKNEVLYANAATGSSDGHTAFGNGSLGFMLSQHLSLQLEYTRLHQNYVDIPALSFFPDRNRAAVSISYQFERPLGR